MPEILVPVNAMLVDSDVLIWTLRGNARAVAMLMVHARQAAPAASAAAP